MRLSALFILSRLLGLSHCRPFPQFGWLWHHGGPKVDVQPAPITTALFQRLELMEQYAAASYCDHNNKAPFHQVACPGSENCPLVEQADSKVVIGLTNAPKTDVTGFVASDYTNKLTVMSFRGTESVTQAAMDLAINLSPIDICPGCKAGQGFWSSWNESRPVVIAAVHKILTENPEHSVVAVGHSLGGAIATLAAAELRSHGLTVHLYTLGAPRTGNENLAQFIQNTSPSKGRNYRMTHYNDPVPRLPPAWLGYSHFYPEIYIDVPNQKPATVEQVYSLDGKASNYGNEQWMTLDSDSHRWYFNNVTQCYQKAGFETPMSAFFPSALLGSLSAAWTGSLLSSLGYGSPVF